MSQLPGKFAALDPFVELWAVATTSERHNRRLTSTAEQRRAFYEAMREHFDDILEYFGDRPLDDIAGEDLTLLRLALAAPQVELAVKGQADQEEQHAVYARRVRLSRDIDCI